MVKLGLVSHHLVVMHLTDKSSTDTTLTDLTDAQLILSNTGTATTNQR